MIPLIRRLRAPKQRRRLAPAKVLIGWTANGRPVASIPVRSAEAVEARIRHWKRKGYRVSGVVEWDFI